MSMKTVNKLSTLKQLSNLIGDFNFTEQQS